jgi:hypothetical protein
MTPERRTTIAMSLLVHGEAVRFNRGQSRGDDFDFKYMIGRDAKVFPYVSSQCFKKYWRESLPEPFSPIIREKDAAGKEKNQAFTSGNPIGYADDDLFGYMVAGATENPGEGIDAAESPDEDGSRLLDPENIKDPEALRKRLLDSSPLSQFILDKSPGKQEIIADTSASAPEVQNALLDALDQAARAADLAKEERFVGTRNATKLLSEVAKASKSEEIHQLNKTLLLRAFSKELQDKPKRPTTRRTAPVRMHALVAFSGIKTAKDFQTFSRDIPYTGKNSIVNPAVQGIYSGWLKTRILIESHRIGKFYIGENMDILREQAEGKDISKEPNPYSRDLESVEYVQLPDALRTSRLRAAIRALADIGNKQGPASGALHDGSLRPKAFIAGVMNCADSPFDYIWAGHNDESMPYLDINLLRESIKDWEDLFASKKIYIGLPVDAGHNSVITNTAGAGAAAASPAADIRKLICSELKAIGFEAIVESPRKALIRLAEEAVL